jgi:hypothetical protein
MPEKRMGERWYSSYSFSTSALDGGEISASPPQSTPGERTLDTHCTGGWVGVIAGLDTEVTGKILSPLPGIEPRSPVVRQYTDLTTRLTTYVKRELISESIY